MSDLAKEIRVLVDNYVTSADDQRLREHWQRLQGDHRHGTVQDMQSRVESETMSSTGDLRGPQSNAGQVQPRHTGRKRRCRRTASRSERGSNVSAEEDLHAELQSNSGQTADGDSEQHLGAEAEPPLLRGRRTRAVTRDGTPSCVQPRRSQRRRKDRGQGN
ncbi:hypothetical protein F443_07646 [Phytophthora nicotianae P1569]|uniref:Uncharacterized protein n=1 Tax=Phytophthora nicotianae P1569 TaxID=1317065 RepID=V9FB26_PHYNI|nr:hypothetical protein F443_07646 [Phytophthora nicotianae P1569]